MRCCAQHGYDVPMTRGGRHERDDARSSSPATAAWSARPSCAGCRRAATQDLLTAHARRARPAPTSAQVRQLLRGAPHRRRSYLAAAKVGGIQANNTYPADFIYENLVIQCNVIHAAHAAGVQRLLFLGSSLHLPARWPRSRCARTRCSPARSSHQRALRDRQDRRHQAVRELQPPVRARLPQRDADQPVRPGRQLPPREQPRHPGAAAPLPRGRAAGRRRGGDLGQRRSRMREFLHVDDMAAACVHVMDLPRDVYRQHTQPMLCHINVGSGVDCTIRELAETDRASHRLHRAAGLRREQARRHAAQADGRVAPRGTGMARAHRPRGRAARRLPLVRRAPRRSSPLTACPRVARR